MDAAERLTVGKDRTLVLALQHSKLAQRQQERVAQCVEVLQVADLSLDELAQLVELDAFDRRRATWSRRDRVVDCDLDAIRHPFCASWLAARRMNGTAW